MRRRKRLNIIRVGIALAAVAVMPVATAQASSASEDRSLYQPWTQSSGGVSPDDRAVARGEVATPSTEIPYLSHGQGVDASQFGGGGGGVSPDDRAVTRGGEGRSATVEPPTPAELGYPVTPSTTGVEDGGSTIDINPYAFTGFGLALLLVLGSVGFAIRHRRSTLSPA